MNPDFFLASLAFMAIAAGLVGFAEMTDRKNRHRPDGVVAAIAIMGIVASSWATVLAIWGLFA